MRVLIVDDHAPMRALLRSVVGDLAEETIECVDGAGAVEAYGSRRLSHADLVLMDVQMPGVDGLEATRRLRSAFPDARIIVVTGYGDRHLRDAAARAGACGCVLKEDLQQLRGLLRAR